MNPNETRQVLMHPRFKYTTAAPGVCDAMDALDQYLADSSIDRRLLTYKPALAEAAAI